MRFVVAAHVWPVLRISEPLLMHHVTSPVECAHWLGIERYTPAPLERRVAVCAQRTSYSSRSKAVRTPCWLVILAVASALARSPDTKTFTRPPMMIPRMTMVTSSSTMEKPASP